jgi:hypothetical protein
MKIRYSVILVPESIRHGDELSRTEGGLSNGAGYEAQNLSNTWTRVLNRCPNRIQQRKLIPPFAVNKLMPHFPPSARELA